MVVRLSARVTGFTKRHYPTYLYHNHITKFNTQSSIVRLYREKICINPAYISQAGQ